MTVSVPTVKRTSQHSDAGYSNALASDTRQGNWMQTYSGARFWPLDPRPEEISFGDIAHALGNLCRFNGHCKTFYSVAEHSVLVSYLVPPEHARQALMHDATEAYLGDMIRPLKPMMPKFMAAEERLWLAIAERFDLPFEMAQCVKDADNAMLMREAADIMAPPPEPWNVDALPAEIALHLWSPQEASRRFRERGVELGFTTESL